MNALPWRSAVLVPFTVFAIGIAAAEGPSGPPTPETITPTPAPQTPTNVDKAGAPVETRSPASVLIPESLSDISWGSWEDWFKPGRWGGSIGLALSGQREKITSADSSQTFSSRIADETITIRNEDFALIDRRLMSGTIGLTFGLEQFRQTVEDVKASEHEKLLGYNFDLAFLPETPYRSNLFANRTQSTVELISGGTSKTEVENAGLILRVGENSILRTREILPYFSASLEAVQEHDKETTRVGDTVFSLNEQLESAKLDLRNGTEVSDLYFTYTANRVTDYLSNANSYQAQGANLLYSLDFGPTLNWHLDSSVDYYSRNGTDSSSSVSSTNVSETLTIDHYDNLSSQYNYGYDRQDSVAGTVTVQSAGMQLVHRLYNNLTTSAGVFASNQTLPTGSADARTGQVNFSYDHGIPGAGNLNAALGGSYTIATSHVPGGTVPVVDAPYTAPPSFGTGIGFQLKDSFIDISTISIVDVKGGSRIPTVVNVDYMIVVAGNRTSIEPLPTSVIIMPNDPLQISYVYSVPPDLKYRITTNYANLGLFWQWISLNFSHNESDSKPLTAGDTSLLVSSRQDSAQLGLNGVWDKLQARGDAMVLRARGNQLDYDSVLLDEFASYAVTPDVLLSLSANQYRTDYTLPVRKVTGSSLRFDANMTWGGWIANAYALQRNYSDTEIGSEKYQEAGFNLQRRWLKLELTLNLSANRRWRSGTETQNATAQFTAVRQF